MAHNGKEKLLGALESEEDVSLLRQRLVNGSNGVSKFSFVSFFRFWLLRNASWVGLCFCFLLYWDATEIDVYDEEEVRDIIGWVEKHQQRKHDNWAFDK